MKLGYLLIFSLLYFLVVIFALCICSGIIIIQETFGEGCGLNAVVSEESVLPEITYTTSTGNSACLYVIYMPIAIAHISLYLVAYHMYPTITIILGRKPSYEVWPKSCFTLSIMLSCVMFLGCLDITKGFSRTCRQLELVDELRHKSCQESFSLVEWRKNRDGHGIYSMLMLAEVSSWIAFNILVIASLLWSYLIFYKTNVSFEKAYRRHNSISTVSTTVL